MTAFISPYRADRDRGARDHAPAIFHRDLHRRAARRLRAARPKGLYKKARAGRDPEFTGISAPYEPPVAPELEIPTGEWTPERCLAALVDYVERRLAYRAAAKLQAVAPT